MSNGVADTVRSLASTPVTIDVDATVDEAAQSMGLEHIGSLVVTENGAPVGLVTDRDVTMAALLRPAGTAVPTVGSVASRPLLMLREDASLVEATRLFERHCIRRVGLVDTGGELVGVLAADSVLLSLGRPFADLTEALAREFREERDPTPEGSPSLGHE